LDAQAVSDQDSIDFTFTTGSKSTDTGGTFNVKYRGPESTSLTITGTPVVNDSIFFRVAREVANAGDTLAINARLHGIMIYYTNDTTREA
jgi:hypothetical protein